VIGQIEVVRHYPGELTSPHDFYAALSFAVLSKLLNFKPGRLPAQLPGEEVL
jgi:hypothetical protein